MTRERCDGFGQVHHGEGLLSFITRCTHPDCRLRTDAMFMGVSREDLDLYLPQSCGEAGGRTQTGPCVPPPRLAAEPHGWQPKRCYECGHTEGEHRCVTTPRRVIVGICLHEGCDCEDFRESSSNCGEAEERHCVQPSRLAAESLPAEPAIPSAPALKAAGGDANAPYPLGGLAGGPCAPDPSPSAGTAPFDRTAA